MTGLGVITYTHSVTEGPAPTPTWFVPAPPKSAKPSPRFLLAPGIWIVRERQWWPVSVLDTAALAPPLTDVEPVKRIFPFVEWHELANCLAGPGDIEESDSMFFGVDDENHPALPPRKIAAARAKCARCPVARTCLTWALTEREEFGIWGGQTGRQRTELQKRMNRGATVAELVAECLPG